MGNGIYYFINVQGQRKLFYNCTTSMEKVIEFVNKLNSLLTKNELITQVEYEEGIVDIIS